MQSCQPAKSISPVSFISYKPCVTLNLLSRKQNANLALRLFLLQMSDNSQYTLPFLFVQIKLA